MKDYLGNSTVSMTRGQFEDAIRKAYGDGVNDTLASVFDVSEGGENRIEVGLSDRYEEIFDELVAIVRKANEAEAKQAMADEDDSLYSDEELETAKFTVPNGSKAKLESNTKEEKKPKSSSYVKVGDRIEAKVDDLPYFKKGDTGTVVHTAGEELFVIFDAPIHEGSTKDWCILRREAKKIK